MATPEKDRRRIAAWRKANKDAVNRYARNWRAKNPASSRKSKLKCQYGLSLEDFDQLAEFQNHACAICERIKPLVVDHNHTTGEVRQLLCSNCNRGLGFFQDCHEMLRRATLYLKVHNVRV